MNVRDETSLKAVWFVYIISRQTFACKAVMTVQDSLFILLYRSLIYTTLHHNQKKTLVYMQLNYLLHASR